MKFVDEFRDPALARKMIEEIRRTSQQRWVLMDVCGGQTHSLLRYGIEEALSDCIELIHGPGCPVCVTCIAKIDFAQMLALRPDVTLTTFGDMLRVPGSAETLLDVRARGGRLRSVVSPLDAVKLAQQNPREQIVFFGVGFETTAPATALAILQAQRLGLDNFTVLASHVRVLPAMEALMCSSTNRVQGFLAAGHVCAVTGYDEYHQFASNYKVPLAVTGFEPLDLLYGISALVRCLERRQNTVENCYARNVRPEGNLAATQAVRRVYEIADCSWRGFGIVERGGFRIRDELNKFDAEQRFGNTPRLPVVTAVDCMGADIMSGRIKPPQCPHFGTRCTVDSPMGAPMVSSEGACAAYMRYRTVVSAD